MAFYDKFPYTNFQELNLDRIVEDIGDIQRAEQATADSAAAAAASEAAAAQSENNAAGSAEAAAADAATIRNDRVQIAQNTRDIATTNTRIDTLVVSASETQSAEVIDIRTAASGFTPASYDTAGDAVRGQIEQLYQTGLTYKGALPTALSITDLDSIILSGFYNIPSGSVASMTNLPAAKAGILEVLYANGICIQKYYTFSPVTYVRYRNSSARWTIWKLIETRSNTERIENILPPQVHAKNRPYIQTHQGAKRTAPANSLPAYVKAGEMGFDGVQIAVIRQSASGTWYVLHDDDLSISTNGTGLLSESLDSYVSTLHINQGTGVADYTDAELKIPTLDEVLQICKHYGLYPSIRLGTMPANIDTDENLASVTALFGILNKYDISKMIFSGTSSQINLIKLRLCGEAAVEWFYDQITDTNVTNIINAVMENGYDNVFVLSDAEAWTASQIKSLHSHNILTAGYYDTPNYVTTGIPDMTKYRQFVEMGMDILQTSEITYEDYKDYIDSTWSWNQ